MKMTEENEIKRYEHWDDKRYQVDVVEIFTPIHIETGLTEPGQGEKWDTVFDTKDTISYEVRDKETAEALCERLNILDETINTESRLLDKEDLLEVEHINDIYRRFGFDGVIEYSEDKLSEFGLVREIEPGLWVMATGGWSEHEDWIYCLNQMLCAMVYKGHYRGYLRGGAFYYTKEPYQSVEIVIK